MLLESLLYASSLLLRILGLLLDSNNGGLAWLCLDLGLGQLCAVVLLGIGQLCVVALVSCAMPQ